MGFEVAWSRDKIIHHEFKGQHGNSLFEMHLFVVVEGQRVVYTIPILCQISSASFEPTQFNTMSSGVIHGYSPSAHFSATLPIEETLVEFWDKKKCPHQIPIQPIWHSDISQLLIYCMLSCARRLHDRNSLT